MIVVDRLRFSVGPFALQDLSLEVARGEYFVLLGPSGSGKTLFLESLCGLHRIDSGRILVDGSDVTRLEPRRRRIGYLPQDYALFPHLSVRTNVAFGLRNPLATRFGGDRRQVDELLQLVDLAPLAGRKPRNLSGGEKQRVALARALAVQPLVLLLDEPVSALDEQMRDTLCRQIRDLQRRTGTTTIHVCHNFAEMLAVADRVGVIQGGRIIQVGTPLEILQRPRNRFVAQFVQSGNVLTGRAASDGRCLRITWSEGVAFQAAHTSATAANRDVTFVIRPENIRVWRDAAPQRSPGMSWLSATICELTDLGALVRLSLSCPGGLTLQALLGRQEFATLRVQPGDHVTLTVEPSDVHVLADD
jgi:ABC-type Fe3+/spermidine/putrescine transport system ATPase subunit